MRKYFIEIKITFGKNTCDNPNTYTLTKDFKFSCAEYFFTKYELKIHQDNHVYSFDLDEIDEIFIKAI